MNVLLKEEKWLLLKGSKSKYDWAKTTKEKSKSAEGVRGQSTDYGRMTAKCLILWAQIHIPIPNINYFKMS